ncbi:MAG: WhiB family transcriptional regulator [Acidimicrobiales bacterium]
MAAAEVEGADWEALLEAVERNRPSWQADALCREYPLVSWFVEKGETTATAKRICGRCLVLTDCRRWALEQGPELAGVFGGLSARERAQLRPAPGPTGRPFPLAPLEAASRLSRRALARRLGVAVSTLQKASTRGITQGQAEWWAAELGLSPERVWPDQGDLLAS